MQMIGSDFDGTIVQRKTISTKTREQIEAFRKRGNQFVIVSGRTVAKMKEGLKKIRGRFLRRDHRVQRRGDIGWEFKLDRRTDDG